MLSSVTAEMFRSQYATCSRATSAGARCPVPTGDRFAWEADSTYIRKPAVLRGLTREPAPLTDLKDARVLALLGDSITTDHISPAGAIRPTARRAATSSSTAWSRRSSTRTARAAATTR
jgi:aconitate hydratase